MIIAEHGEIHLTIPDYSICNTLGVTKAEVDLVVEATLGADLTSILGALAEEYGAEHAMEMWTKSAKFYIEALKGE